MIMIGCDYSEYGILGGNGLEMNDICQVISKNKEMKKG